MSYAYFRSATVSCVKIRKYFHNRSFGWGVRRKDLLEGRQICSDAELIARCCHSEVNTDRGPKLQAHGVITRAVECLDAQAMFEPLEEQFALPALPVGFGDDRGWSAPEIAPEDEATAVVGIVKG